MKGCGKIVLRVAVMTVLVVCYVHSQIELLRVSYILDKKTHLKSEKTEKYLILKYELEQMKSPRLLESKLGEWNFDLTLPKEIKVIRMAEPVAWNLQVPVASGVEGHPLVEKISNFLERWVKVAQAKTDV